MLDLKRANLKNHIVALELVREEHRDELKKAADDPSLWRYMFGPADGDHYDAWFDTMLAADASGEEFAYVVRLNESGELVGSSRFLNIVPSHARLEIGSTWYAKDVWGSAVNPSCKYLLFAHAFEEMGVRRLEMKTHPDNARSRAAIAKSGATFEGVLRNHVHMGGGKMRDSAMFAITNEDWPAVKGALTERLNGLRH